MEAQLATNLADERLCASTTPTTRMSLVSHKRCLPHCPKGPSFRCLATTVAAAASIILVIVISSSSAHQQATKSNNHASAFSTPEAISNSKFRSQTLLARFKRQQSGSSSGQGNGGSSPSIGGSNPSSASGDPNDPNNPNANQDDKPIEETLNSLKCDFGSADALDLCKFKISDNSDNPLSPGLATWTLGSGRTALFQGGPLIDGGSGNDTSGGYIFYETSNPFISQPTPANQSMGLSRYSIDPYGTTLHASEFATSFNQNPKNQRSSIITGSSQQQHQQGFQQVLSTRLVVGLGNNGPYGPALTSPNLTSPGPSGMCLSFQYAIQGLSAEELRVFVNDHKTGRSRMIWSSFESAGGNWTKGEVLYSVTNTHSLTFVATSSTAPSITKDSQQRRFRGHIAIDEIDVNKHDPQLADGPCKGHCNFDGDLCGWTNSDDGQEDDFEWLFGRGSDNLFTGPPRDFTSSANNEITGSYLYTDSGFPRRPGDRALLVSPMFQPTAVNDAMCMRIAVHMFGSGIGSLVIKIRYAEEGFAAALPGSANTSPLAGSATDGGGGGASAASSGGSVGSTSGSSGASSQSSPATLDGPKAGTNELIIWEMFGDAGNSWHQAQTSVSSSKSPFQVVIEGTVGENHLGNIAIDEISFSPGACPTSPPVASKNYGDCTFEQSMCYWRNPDAEIHLDDLDWVRSADEQSIHGPNFDHTLKKRSGSYLKLENTFREPKSGTRAFLLSPIFQPKASGSVQCLSFYYYMFMRSISSSGPNLGTIRVYLASNNELVPIWRLTNPISSPNWKHARASLSTAMIDGQPVAPTKLFQIAFEGIWGDAPSGALALDDITVFDGACEIWPPEARSVPGECTFDVDLCSWSNRTYDLIGNADSAIDSSRSPFLQSVNNAIGSQYAGRLTSFISGSNQMSRRMSWQLATIDNRPVNLQDHTYKAPIGYVFVDVLDSSSQQMAFPLQSIEVTVQSGQQIVQCLSFWFAAYGRQDGNRLDIHLTQASAPPQSPDDGSSGNSNTRGQSSNSSGSGGQSSGQGSSQASGQASGSASSSLVAAASGLAGSSTDSETENANAWKNIDGKLIWSMSLKNITDVNRRKWLYGQVTLKADSNHIVRFVAITNDGGFALDDISYFDGACQTRPIHAKVYNDDDDDTTAPQSSPTTASKPA